MAITRIGNPAIADVRGVNFRNIIINGDMSIAQRGTSATGLGNGDTGYHTCDRWKWTEGGSPTFEFTMSQDTDVPTGQGFANSLKYDCTTADTSFASSDLLRLQQEIEGQNLQYLKKGTSNAESLTVSFWVKSNKTGTYIAELEDRDNSRYISQSYTISSADTWEKKTITFSGDTSGTLDNDNGNSLRLNFWLGGGSDFTSGTLSTTWHTTNANRAVGQVNLADSTSNEWYITGVQLEAGSQASDFEFLPHDVNLQRCQRYFIANFQGSAGQAYTSTDGLISLRHPVSLRANASVSQKSGVSITIDIIGGSQNASGYGLSGSGHSAQATAVVVTGLSGRTTNQTLIMANSGTQLSAEL
mgnify:CR=1 FL=1